MIGVLALAFVSWTICSAFQDGVHRSSLMYGSKPILRLGPDQPDEADSNAEDETETPKMPEWVSNLRSNIQSVIREKGLKNADSDIRQMIAEVDVDENTPSDDVKVPLRSGPGYVPKPPSWERELKSYVNELMRTQGTFDLDKYVRPVIKSIENAQGVAIRDIDVDPHGEITINYLRTQENNMGFPMQRQGMHLPGSHYTMGLE